MNDQLTAASASLDLTQRDAPAPAATPRDLAVLLVILLAAAAIRSWLWVGYMGTDDMAAASTATYVARGVFPPPVEANAVASIRFGFILPIAALVWLLGSSEFSVGLFPLIMSLLGTALTWDLARRLSGSVVAAHLAAVLLTVTSLNVIYSSSALPDLPMSVLGLAAVWCVCRGWELGRRPSAWVWMFGSGLAVAWAVGHKIIGVQAGFALAVWGLSLLVTRQFRWSILASPIGFLAGFGSELLFFRLAYGDWLHRFTVISDGLAGYRERLVDLVGVDPGLTARLAMWAERLPEDMPAAMMTMLLGAVLTGIGLVLAWRSPRIRLVCLFVLVHLALRGIELTQTFSYQPRRLLPFIAMAAVLLAVFAARWTRPYKGRYHASLGLLAGIVAVQSLGLVVLDRQWVLKEATKLDPEQRLMAWYKAHREEVASVGLFTDPRTWRIADAFLGFPRPRAPIEMLYYDIQSGITQVHVSPAMREGSFVFDNPRLVYWMMPAIPGGDQQPFRIFGDFTDEWRMISVIPQPNSGFPATALWQATATVGDCGEPTEILRLPFDPEQAETDQELGGWYKSKVPSDAELSIGPDQSLDVRRGAKPVEVVSGGAGVTRVPMQKLDIPAGSSVVLRVTMASGEKREIGPWPRPTLRMIGYDADGQRVDIGNLRPTLVWDEQEFRVYGVAPQALQAVRVVLRFNDPGTYRVSVPQIEVYANPCLNP